MNGIIVGLIVAIGILAGAGFTVAGESAQLYQQSAELTHQ